MSTVDNERPPYVAFETRAVEDRAASVAQGHYVAKDVIFVTVTRPGSRDTSDFVAEEWLKRMQQQAQNGTIPPTWVDAFHQRFEAFKKNETLPEEGTPIKGWQLASPAVQQTLLQAGFRTVEELATAGDAEIRGIGTGAITFREKARAWLDEAKTKGVSAEKIADLTQKIADLTDLTQRLLDENKALREKAEAGESKDVAAPSRPMPLVRPALMQKA